MKKILFYLLVSVNVFGQIQVGSNLNGTNSGDQFGIANSISSDGNMIAIGSPFNDTVANNSGQVNVYAFDGVNWNLLGNPINGSFSGDNFGSSVSLSSNGNVLAIGAPNANVGLNDLGQVKIYTFSGGDWQQLGNEINGVVEDDFLGGSVSMSADGNVLAVGMPGYASGNNRPGRVKIYSLNEGNWTLLGEPIDGGEIDFALGNRLQLSADGSTLIVSGYNFQGLSTNSSRIKVYNYNGISWLQKGSTFSNVLADDNLLNAVAITPDGNTIVIGTPGNDGNGNDAGKVNIFEYNGTDWLSKGQVLAGIANSNFGYSVNISENGTTLVVSAPNHNNIGKCFIYQYISNNWSEILSDISSVSGGDFFGFPTSLSSSNILLIGIPLNDTNGTNSGQVKVFDINNLLGVNTQEESNKSISFYPNPVSDKLFLIHSYDSNVHELNFFDCTGKLVKTEDWNETKEFIDVSSLEKGIYFVETKYEDNKNEYNKLIKN